MPAAANAATAYIKITLGEGNKQVVTQIVKQVEIEDNDRLIDMVKMQFDDPEGPIASMLQEKIKVQVDMGWVSEKAILFEGIITSVTSETQGATRLVKVTALDPSYLLMKESKTASHTGKLSEIITRIVQASNIPIGQIKLDDDPTFTPTSSLQQVGKRDWEFIQDLAATYHARAYVEYAEEKGQGAARFYFHPESQLLSGDPMGRLVYCHGFSQLTEFKFKRIAAGADAQRTATVADSSSGKSVTTPAAPSKPTANPDVSSDLNAELDKINPGLGTKFEQMSGTLSQPSAPDQRPLHTFPGQPSDKTLPARISQQDPTRILGLIGEGTAIGTVNLRAKGKVTIAGIASWVEGDWYVRRVRHIYTRMVEKDKDRSTYRVQFIVTR
jgi:phage protein D